MRPLSVLKILSRRKAVRQLLNQGSHALSVERQVVFRSLLLFPRDEQAKQLNQSKLRQEAKRWQ